jgi:outer membrane immunogenic protein
MKFRILLGASLLAVVASTGAYAADAIVAQEPAPMAAPAFSWGGAYIGGEVGWGWGRAKLDDKNNGQSSEFKPNGFIGGVYAGYNFDMGNNVILGVDGNFDYNDLKKSHDYISNGSAVQTSAETKLRWSGAVRARAGYAVDRLMPYIAGGVAFGGVKNSLNIGGSSYDSNKTLTGWTIGTGVDYAATDNVLLRLEYRYTDFGNKDFGLGNINTRGSFKTNDIRLGVAYKF